MIINNHIHIQSLLQALQEQDHKLIETEKSFEIIEKYRSAI